MEHIGKAAMELKAKLEASGPVAEISATIPVNECGCDGSGWLRVCRDGKSGVTRCSCAKRRIYDAQLALIPERFRNASFENYVPMDSHQEAALAVVSGSPQSNYFLWGPYGRGKTHLATAQYRTMIEAGQSCAWRTMGDLISELTAAVVRDEMSRVIQSAKYADSFHLFIDDIDKFKSTEFKHEALFDLVDTLYKRKLGLTITSNYGLRALDEFERVHPAILRRIDDMTKAVEV